MNEAKEYVKNKVDKKTKKQYEYTLNRIIFLAKKEIFVDIKPLINDICNMCSAMSKELRKEIDNELKLIEKKHFSDNSNITNKVNKK